MQQEIARSQRSVAAAVADLEELQNERDRLELEPKQPVEMAEPNNAEDEDDSKDEQRSLQELTEALRESEYRESRLGTELELLRSVRTEFEALRADNQNLEDELRSLREEREVLKDKANEFGAEAENAKRELLRLREEVTGSAPDRAPQPERAGQLTSPESTDDLTEIEGISEALEEKLHAVGIFQYAQIAAWDDDDISAYSKRLGFKDRIVRDCWVEQANALLQPNENESNQRIVIEPNKDADLDVQEDLEIF